MAKCFIDKEEIEPARPAKYETKIVLTLTPSEAALIKYLVGNVSMTRSQDHLHIYYAMNGVDSRLNKNSGPVLQPGDYYNGGEK